MTEILIIAATIYFEAACQSCDGKEAVATVIWNRAANREMSMAEVCQEPWQFTCWNKTRSLAEINRKGDAWKDCYDIAAAMVSSEFEPQENWNHYYNPDLANPSWAKDMRNTRKIGDHLFGVIE